MKQSVLLLILIIVGMGAYTLYGMVAFVPDEASPFVFNEPTLPPEIAKQYEEDKKNILSSSEVSMKTRALATAEKAVNSYQNFQESVPPQATDTMTIISNRVSQWELPPYFLSPKLDAAHKRSFEQLEISAQNFAKAENERGALSCTSKTPPSEILIGTNGNDTLECATQGDAGSSDRLFLGGPGNDNITDTIGNRIINSGSGDDTIAVGEGRTIMILDDGWGKDQLSVDCTGAKIEPGQIPDFEIPWSFGYTNFIVLSARVDASKLEWQDNVLVNTATGDSLTVSEKCFNVVPPLESVPTTVPAPTPVPTQQPQ